MSATSQAKLNGVFSQTSMNETFLAASPPPHLHFPTADTHTEPYSENFGYF
jgi:hypothetical protein